MSIDCDVLYGQKFSDPTVMQIRQNIVRRHQSQCELARIFSLVEKGGVTCCRFAVFTR